MDFGLKFDWQIVEIRKKNIATYFHPYFKKIYINNEDFQINIEYLTEIILSN